MRNLDTNIGIVDYRDKPLKIRKVGESNKNESFKQVVDEINLESTGANELWRPCKNDYRYREWSALNAWLSARRHRRNENLDNRDVGLIK